MFWNVTALLMLLLGLGGLDEAAAAASNANRLTYLTESDPFYVDVNFPKLTTPQWVGEPGVEAVIILAIDDMRQPGPYYETMLRPIINRLKQIDGRAPISIMCNTIEPTNVQYAAWVKEGLSLEVHTLTHPCPILARSNFQAAADTYFGSISLLKQVPGNRPCAFRTPCCDSINSASPRLFAELINQVSPTGDFLTIDSSVMNVFTTNDPAMPTALVLNEQALPRFPPYIPTNTFTTTIENYPYPYVIGGLCWEFPAICPSDWEASHLHGSTNPVTVADWKAALDATVLKQGTFTMIFHPHGWIRSDQMVELIDYAANKYGSKIKFLNFREAQGRLNTNLLGGETLRAANGQENGVRLLDVNNDGYLDALIGNEHVQKTRVWDLNAKVWKDIRFPSELVRLVTPISWYSNRFDASMRFGVVSSEGLPMMLFRNETNGGAWQFDGKNWVEDRLLLAGLELDGKLIATTLRGVDQGVRLRDIDHDGVCELIVANPTQNAIFSWSEKEKRWDKLPFALPGNTSIVDAAGRDNGLRFVDINEDGFEDVIFSNARQCSIYLFVAQPVLGFGRGWTREVMAAKRGEPDDIPMIVRDGPHANNGAWFHSNAMWVQNEDTASLPGLVEKRTYKELVAGQVTRPKSPKESLASIKVRPGFKVELVASEPLIESPVAFDWGADGKLWVVEMVDYPLGVDGSGKPGGVVRFLEDTNHSGQYNKSTVFLDGLNFPNGIIPWRKGILVSTPPDIIYAEDTDGDGKADKRVTLFTGFREGNQQHRANGFDYGLDNWLNGANGESGGRVRSVMTGKTVNINGRDFRFRPDDGAFETQAGQTQFGRHRDDWGNWFGNNNSSGAWHYFLQEHYLARNPYVAAPATRQVMPNYAEFGRVFPASRLAQRFNDPWGANHLTSANSTMPYRDDLFGPAFERSYFVSEPVHNLVHREVMEPDGVSFTSHRAADEQESEFFASSDNWCRPTMTKTGPDGALYIADMYRLVIEHPEWIPQDFQKSVDLRAGAGMGRVYRMYPTNTVLPPVPRLDQLKTDELVAAMESPNGWKRDTVQRLLVCAGDKAAVKPLEQLFLTSKNPKARLQALCTLDGLHAVSAKLAAAALKDRHGAVRENAVRICESLAEKSTEIRQAMLALTSDPEIRVRYQLAFSLGEVSLSVAGKALARIALEGPQDEHLQLAVRTSVPRHLKEMLGDVVAALQQTTARTTQGNLFRDLTSLSVASKNDPATLEAVRAIGSEQSSGQSGWQFAGLSGLLEGLGRRGMTLDQFQSDSTGDLKAALSQLERVFVAARKAAADSSLEQEQRLAAIGLLGRSGMLQNADIDLLAQLLGAQNSPEVRAAALSNLKQLRNPRVADVLIASWKGSSPGGRDEIIALLLGRQEWSRSLLAAIQEGRIPAAAIGAAQRQKLLTHADRRIQEQAQRVFTAANSDREAVVQKYLAAIKGEGDAQKGRVYFQQNCIQCHRLRDEGNEVGADLGSVATKPVDYLVTSILDPNRSVEARYMSYTATMKDDLEYTGIIVAETANNITLRQAGGKDVVLLRSDFKDLNGGTGSLMPDGFENSLSPGALRDLISYIRGANPKN